MSNSVKCVICEREALLGEPTEGVSKQQERWFILNEKLVCGGNFHGDTRIIEGRDTDLFPDGSGGFVEREVMPMKRELELDNCVVALHCLLGRPSQPLELFFPAHHGNNDSIWQKAVALAAAL